MRNNCQYPKPQQHAGGYNLCNYSCYIYNEETHLFRIDARSNYDITGFLYKMLVVGMKTKPSPATKAEICLTSGKIKLKLLFTERL